MGKNRKAKLVKRKEEPQPVPEPQGTTTNIDYVRVLKEFHASAEEEYTFESDLSRPDRAFIHQICWKMGMKSKSYGKSKNRVLIVCKKKDERHESPEKAENNAICLTFSDQTKDMLQKLFTEFPPDDAELSDKTPVNSSKKSKKIPKKQDNWFCRPSMSKTEIIQKYDTLTKKADKDVKLIKIAQDRSKLPIASFKDAITSSVESHQVVLISGETGCGKTTQVPQYILDYMWSKGDTCKILCTQPRRISAISVAERISYEIGENVGDTVGYKIRLESKGGKHSSIMFCTNGILLRILIDRGIGAPNSKCNSSRDYILDATHIIMDEIHERDRFSDFMLAILRDLLTFYPHLRLILMSATMDAERFSQYFSGCPIIRVPGFTYPVQSFYLENVLSILGSTQENHIDMTIMNGSEKEVCLTHEHKTSLDEYIDLALLSDECDPLLELISADPTPKVINYQHSTSGISPLMVFAGKGMVSGVYMLLSLDANCYLMDNNGKTALEWAQQESQNETSEIIEKHKKKGVSKTCDDSELLDKYLASINPEHIDIFLIVQLLQRICTDSQDGAILVFLPGWDDIRQTRENLLSSPFFKDSSKFMILSLHSMVPAIEQRNVFKRPPAGARKIILSTNIAETAVTIDDVVYVIDSGRMKEKNYDPYNNVSTLFSSWVSKANAKQREGRAGRCQPGICYHLYSKLHAATLPNYQLPEIKRMPIAELCLQVKLLNPNYQIVDFLQRTLDPPVHEATQNAITVLQNIGALTRDEKLTELGEKLGVLPVHPSISKMLFFAILMNCLDPALTLACTADYKDPFVFPMAPNERKRALAAKKELASIYGGYSDHLTTVAAFDCWKRARGKGQASLFCSKYFVSSSTMEMLSNMRNQLSNELIRNGLIPKDMSNCSLNSRDPGILRAILLAGNYPNVGKIPPTKKRAVVDTPNGAKVALHSHSSNFDVSFDKSVDGLLLAYDEITQGERRMYIKNCSIVSPYPLILLATDMAVLPSNESRDVNKGGSQNEVEMEMNVSTSEQKGEDIMSSPENNVTIVIDQWLKFKSTALAAAQIYCLRQRLSAAILYKVKHPRTVLPPALDASICTIASILSSDGMVGISPPLKDIHHAASSSIPGGETSEKGINRKSISFLGSLMRDTKPFDASGSMALHPDNFHPGVQSPHINTSQMRDIKPFNASSSTAPSYRQNSLGALPPLINTSQNCASLGPSKKRLSSKRQRGSG